MEGATWDEWLERLGEESWPWSERFRQASLGSLRANFQDVPTPRYVLCLFDPESSEAYEGVPLIAKACDQAGVAGGVALRLFPYEESRDIARQYMTGERNAMPLCVVFDSEWVQIGLLQLGPRGGTEAEWRQQVLRGLESALRGQAVAPWQVQRNLTEHRWKQARRARE